MVCHPFAKHRIAHQLAAFMAGWGVLCPHDAAAAPIPVAREACVQESSTLIKTKCQAIFDARVERAPPPAAQLTVNKILSFRARRRPPRLSASAATPVWNGHSCPLPLTLPLIYDLPVPTLPFVAQLSPSCALHSPALWCTKDAEREGVTVTPWPLFRWRSPGCIPRGILRSRRSSRSGQKPTTTVLAHKTSRRPQPPTHSHDGSYTLSFWRAESKERLSPH